MRSLRLFLLAGSLGLNAALALVILLGRRTAPLTPATPTALVAAPKTAAAPTVDANTWSALVTGDLPALVTRLRDAGFPPDVLRATVAARLGETFSARVKALDPAGENRPFWYDLQSDPKTQSALRQMLREQQAALRELLGPDPDDADSFHQLFQTRPLAFLPAAKAADVRRILREFDDRRSDLFAVGFDSSTDRAKITALDQERDQAVARVLTPEEFHEYNLRTSNLATALRDQLSAFEPTEQEFRALYQLNLPYQEQHGPMAGLTLTPDQMQQRAQAEKTRNEQFKATLSPERALEFDRATDLSYRRTHQLVTRLELPRETTDRLWQVQKEFEQRRTEVVRSPSFDDPRARLAALQQEAIRTLTPILGSARNLEAYQNYSGAWLQNLAPRPVSTAKKP